MKLYAWQPKGHGAKSFFVMADSMESALESVRKHIKEYAEGYDSEGFGTDYYELRVVGPGEVMQNDND